MWVGLIAGKLQSLGITDPNAKEAAEAVFQQLLAALHSNGQPTAVFPAVAVNDPTSPKIPPRTVEATASDFLERRKPKVSAECWRQYNITLRKHFVPVFGLRLLPTLTAEEIEDWADRPTWSSSTRNNNLGVIGTMLSWAKHPIQIHRPPKESRGAEAFLDDDQFAKVIGAATNGGYNSDFIPFLQVLRETGARPQEIARQTVESVDWANTCTRTKLHKTARHGGERIIHFNTAAMAILDQQRAAHGTGYLFRTRKDNPWSGPAIVKRMADISERCGVHATAYGLGRHSFATKALIAGIPDAVVAELLGHKGTAMVTRNYGHVGGQARVLKSAVELVNAKPKAG